MPVPRQSRGTAIPAPGCSSAASSFATQPGVSRTVGLRISTASLAGSDAMAAFAAAANPRFAPRPMTDASGASRRADLDRAIG